MKRFTFTEYARYSITKLEKAAFKNCKSLTTISFQNSATKIEKGVFSFCKNLTSIRIPKGSFVKYSKCVTGKYKHMLVENND